MSVAAKSSPNLPSVRPTVLVVDDEPELIELLSDVVGSMDCLVLTAATIADARRMLAREPIDLLVADLRLPDGDGASLLPALRKRNPAARAIVITGEPTVSAAATAMRHGAVDFVSKPFDATQIVDRVRQALATQAIAARMEKKLRKLKIKVRKLSEARKTISQKVDILCNDLVSAYGELSKQFDVVRTQEGFRKTIEAARDLEQLICQAMDWMMRQIGYSNVAVWLVGEDGSQQLGAYMKYTIPGDEPVSAALKRVILPLAARDGRDAPVKLVAAELGDKLSPDERQMFRDQQFIALDCTYLGESLATLIFFRDAQVPFSEPDMETVKSVGPLFAQALATVVRQGEDDAEPAEGPGDDINEGPDNEGGTANPHKRRKSSKPDPADWWKRGDASPY